MISRRARETASWLGGVALVSARQMKPRAVPRFLGESFEQVAWLKLALCGVIITPFEKKMRFTPKITSSRFIVALDHGTCRRVVERPWP